jgi:hypothetical protein
VRLADLQIGRIVSSPFRATFAALFPASFANIYLHWTSTMLNHFAFLFGLFAAWTFQAGASLTDPMGVEAGATWCRGLNDVKDSGFSVALPMTSVPSFFGAEADPDKRPRWSVNIDTAHAWFTVLRANKDGGGNWQHHLKLHRTPSFNWGGYLIVKAAYPAVQGGPNIDHMFAISTEDKAGCVLTVASGTPPVWSYQLTGYKLRRD